ncbi:tyrosine-type recombinase/integrase [Clostridium thermopalmarium]|uniref:Transposase from transposon Tn916 n=1 Tax=Clostridium thermopalmarium DSM 5974 TaxID=1121340 RepID=A0A2T0APE0_9CLOT|nr:site-specific integrase [Clostridium thermopalmarium]PRR70875.1 Transposase from transposon Tn916 [Clostridium thermopalmarium DSM 5974]PVZ28799.1 site-specific recombinase XerD [Clostridium thermopalmarium DSM 5974]
MKGTIQKHVGKDGKATYSYLVYVGVDENGKKKYKRKRGFKKKKDCEAALAELITQLEKGTLVSNDKMTVNEYLNYWMETYPKNHCQPSTYKRYEFFVNDINSYLGQYKLSKLNPMLIQKFYEDLMNDKKISSNTVLKTHRMFHLALKHAQQWQLINVNPCDLVSPPKAIKTEMKYWQPDEINFYLDTINKDEILYKPTYLAVHTGLRVGELCALQWEDVDLINGTIKVNKTLQRVNGKLILKQPKTKNSSRIVTLLSSTIKFLKELKKEAMERRLKYGVELGYVLCWEDGRPMDPHYVSQKFPKLLEKYNLPKIRFHDLRHTHATLLLKLGTSPKIISERLGHSTVSFTLDIYSHVNVDMQRDEVSKAENFL